MKKLHFALDPNTATLSENDSKKYFSTVGIATFAFIAVTYGVSTLLFLLVGALYPQALDSAVVSNVVSAISQYAIAFPVLCTILGRLPKDTNPSEKMGGKAFWGTLCIAIAMMSVGNTVGNFVITLFENAMGRSMTNVVAESTVGSHWLVNLIFVAVLPPILEELMFRKVLCDRLMPLGEGYAVVVSALIFGLAHGNLFQFFYAFLLGIVFATVYIKTGRLRYTIVYHVIINLLGGVLVPWILDALEPILNEENLARILEVTQSADAAAIEALGAELMPFALPMFAFLAYEVFYSVATVIGVVLIITWRKRISFAKGLLPPAREGKVANVLCNGGVAAAIGAFTVIFMLSLLA